MKDLFSTCRSFGAKKILLDEVDKVYKKQRSKTLLWLTKNLKYLNQSWLNDSFLDSLKNQLMQVGSGCANNDGDVDKLKEGHREKLLSVLEKGTDEELQAVQEIILLSSDCQLDGRYDGLFVPGADLLKEVDSGNEKRFRESLEGLRVSMNDAWVAHRETFLVKVEEYYEIARKNLEKQKKLQDEVDAARK